MGVSQTLRLIREINRGGFGRVEEVRGEDGTAYARKVFDPSPELGVLTAEERAKLRSRFEREVRTQMAMSKGFVLPILEAELSAPEPWFLMPLASKTYSEQIAEDGRNGKITSEPLFDILNGLDELHRLGYVHRDLKPDNVLLDNLNWKLADLGLVSEISGQRTTKLTSTNSIWGSHLYMAPEQAKGLSRVTSAADIYAFGCILCDLGGAKVRVPYQTQTVKGALDPIVRKCTAQDPKKRFPNVETLRWALFSVLSRDKTLPTTPETIAWTSELKTVDSWDEDKVQRFITYVEEVAPEKSESSVVAILESDTLRHFATTFPDEWPRLALAYCDWASGAFTFSFCDVIVRRLEAIFEHANSTIEIRAAAIMSMADVASANNRWFVMDRLFLKADSSMQDDLAERVAIEIQATSAQYSFLRCAHGISKNVTSYHERIVEAIAPSKASP